MNISAGPGAAAGGNGTIGPAGYGNVSGGVESNNTFLGNLGNTLGTDNSFLASQAPTVDAGYYGPSQGTMGGYVAGQQANQQNALNNLNGQQAAAQQGYLSSLGQFGSSNSAAQGMLQQGVNAANNAAMSTARSAGGNPAQQAAAMRQAQFTQAGNIQNGGAQAAQLQAQQQQAALGMEGNQLQSMAGNQLAQAQLGAQGAQGYLGDQLQGAQQATGAQESNNAINSGNFNTAQGLNAGIAGANASSNSQMLGGLAGAAEGAMMMSDMNAKTGIVSAGDPSAISEGTKGTHQDASQQNAGRSMFLKGLSQLSDENVKGGRSPGTNAADQFLSTLKPYTYEYKHSEDEPTDEPHGGRYLGIMAQNVERGPTGDTLVKDTPRGKAIEGAPSMSAALAGIGRLHERLSALEQASRGHHA